MEFGLKGTSRGCRHSGIWAYDVMSRDITVDNLELYCYFLDPGTGPQPTATNVVVVSVAVLVVIKFSKY